MKPGTFLVHERTTLKTGLSLFSNSITCEILPECGFEYVAKQECPEYFADMFRPSGVCGSGHKQIKEERMAKIMAKIADMALAPKIMALAPEIMADGSHPWRHCHAQPSVMRGARSN